MKKNNITAIITLFSGSITSVYCILMEYTFKKTFAIVIIVLLVFFFIGLIIQGLVQKTDDENQAHLKAEAEEKKQEEIRRQEEIRKQEEAKKEEENNSEENSDKSFNKNTGGR